MPKIVVSDWPADIGKALQDLVILRGLVEKYPKSKIVSVFGDDIYGFILRAALGVGCEDCINVDPKEATKGADRFIDLSKSIRSPDYVTATLRKEKLRPSCLSPSWTSTQREKQQMADQLRRYGLEPFGYTIMDLSGPTTSTATLAAALIASGRKAFLYGPGTKAIKIDAPCAEKLSPGWLACLTEMAKDVLFDDRSVLGHLAEAVGTTAIGLLDDKEAKAYSNYKHFKAVKVDTSPGSIIELLDVIEPLNEKVYKDKLKSMVWVSPEGEKTIVIPTRNLKDRFIIAVPPGIGDSLWSMVFVPAILKEAGIEKATIAVRDDNPRRGADFLERFDFVEEAVYVKFPIHDPDVPEVSPEGPYNYIPSQKNFRGMDWLIISNGDLERGRRLETHLPQYKADLEICKNSWRVEKADEIAGDQIRQRIKGKYAVFFLGNLRSNSDDGHCRNGLFSLADWLKLGDLLHELGLSIVVVGAQYDIDYSNMLKKSLGKRDYYKIVTGQTSIGATFDLCRKSTCIFSYQSGIGITSAYFGVPTTVFWRPYGDSTSPRDDLFISFHEDMSHCWCPKYAIGRQILPAIYTKCDPESLVNDAEEAGWFSSSPPHYLRLLESKKIKNPDDFRAWCEKRPKIGWTKGVA